MEVEVRIYLPQTSSARQADVYQKLLVRVLSFDLRLKHTCLHYIRQCFVVSVLRNRHDDP